MTIGAYVGIVFGIITGITLIAGIMLCFLEPWPGVGIIACGLLVGAVTLAANWPLKYEYHHWIPVRGWVTDKNSRLIKDNDSVSQRIVLMVNGKPYGVDDTRATLVRIGQYVSLRCKKEHQFQQPYDADGWACRWGSDQ